jgi:hypothetical protein
MMAASGLSAPGAVLGGVLPWRTWRPWREAERVSSRKGRKGRQGEAESGWLAILQAWTGWRSNIIKEFR